MTQPQEPHEQAAPEPPVPEAPQPSRPRRIHRRLITATCLAVVLGFVALALPTPFVVESPGPALNTIGKVNGKPLIEVSGHESYPAQGTLDMTTVYIVGGGQSRIPFFDVVKAWADPAQDVYPEETLYPRGTTDEQISDENSAEMDDSQQSSIAAALAELDVPYGQQLTVAGLATGTNKGSLRTDDLLKSLNGRKVTDLAMLKSELQRAGDGKLELTVSRGGKDVDVPVTTTRSADGQRQLGVYLGTRYDFPFDVKFTLSNVGGPSAGMMFALGIIDTLTPGDLTGGKNIAGTGTIDAEGAVGPIGGIAQKLVGARKGGADYFLAPAENCADVAGRVPDGLTVVKVATLSQARDAVESIGGGKDPATLPSCR